MAELPDTLSLQSDPKASILLVDDNPANLLSLRTLLEDLGQNLVEVRSGEEAIKLVQSDDFALVLLDVLMPGISGFETAQAIRQNERSRHTPIIFVTASDIERQQLEQGYSLGAVDFLGKPLLPLAVQAKVRGFVQLFQDKQRARHETDQLRLLVEGATDYAIFLLDSEGHVASWNPGAERIKGYKANEIIGQHFSHFYPKDAIERGWPAHELKVAKAEGRFEDEGWRVRKDCTQFWANVIITALHDETGHFVGYSKITRDLTERKKSEENARRLVEETTARRVAEENARLIQEQRERLHVTLASIGDAVISTDAEGRIEFLNSVAQELVGWREEEAVGRPLVDVFHIVNEDTRQPVENPALRALKEGVIVGLANHTVLISKDGHERPIDDSAAPIRDATGRAFGSVLVFRDISERKQNEERLREQQEWLRITLASIGDAVIATDRQGRVTFLNDVAEKLTGWTQADAQGQLLEAVFAILNERTRQPVENPVEKVLRDGAIVGLGNHTVLVAKDGTERPIDDAAAPIRDGKGELIGVVLTFRDVTEQRRTEREVRQSEARKSAILETALDCVITMDHEGNLVEFNPAAEKTFGYRREQVVGRQLADLIIPPSLRERHHKGMAHYLATGEGPVLGKRLELPALRADGTEFPVEIAITRIPTDGPPLFTAYLRDITEQKRAEQHRNVRLAVTYALNEASSVDDGASGILQSVCENLGWDVGFFWTLNEEHVALVCQRSWHRPDVPVDEFERASCSRTFKPGEGLPGRVWASGKPDWILDIAQDANFPRLTAAVNYGLHSAFAYPVVVGDQMLGVIEFFTKRIREADADLLEMMGTVAGNVGQFIERKSAEDELRRSEQELADFFENATIGLHWVGPEGIILRANRAELEMLGYSREEYVGHAIAEFHADEEEIGEILRRLKAGEKLNEYPARLRCKDGSLKDVLIDSSVLWKDGHFVHARCFTRDVTERKRAEESLRESEQRFARFMQHLTGLAWIKDVKGRYVYVNDAAEKAFRTPRAKLYGKTDQEIFPPETAAQFRQNDQQAMTSGAGIQIVEALAQEDGVRYSLVSKFPILGPEGQPALVGGMAIDITDRLQAEEALKEADRRKDEFLATLAHELRNPLAPIRNSLQILKMPRVEAETAQQTRDVMERQVHHLVRLVDDLLDASRVMRGKIELRKEPVELATIVARAVEMTKPLIDLQGHHLDIALPHESLLLDADPVRLAQVVGNLLTNSAKYTEANGKIWLFARQEGDQAVLTVRDNGIGIALDMLPHVFDLFVQADHSTTKAQGGLGIGLTLVKSLVEMHNGSVEAKSAGLGKGCELVVHLPLMAQRTEQLNERMAEKDQAARIPEHRLLVVDDNQDAALTLSMLLRLQGNEVRVAHDGATALEIAAVFQPDMIFLDLGMPGMDGYEVARRVRNTPGLEKTVLAALTGWGQQEDRRRTAEAGFDHHLVKPLEPKVLDGLLAGLKGAASS